MYQKTWIPVDRTCKHCQGVFSATRYNQKYCNVPCRDAYYKANYSYTPITRPKCKEDTFTEDGGYLYAIGEGFINTPIKLGWSINPVERLAGIQTGYPFDLYILGMWRVTSKWEELDLHTEFHEYRIHPNREWFRPEKRLVTYIQKRCELRQREGISTPSWEEN